MTKCLQSVASQFAPFVALIGLAASDATAQFCPVTSTYFSANYSLCGGGTATTCWASSPFPGSTAITGSQYPSTNYACATTVPAAGALDNTLYTYDGNGNLKVTKDPIGNITTNSYDALNRLTQVLDPATKTTTYAYNGNNTLVQVTDPRTLNTVYSPNGFGETLQQNSPDTGITTNTYDLLGRLQTKQDARLLNTVTYTYDDIGRVILESYASGGTITYTYDQGTYGKGRLYSVQDAGMTTFTYEAHGRVAQKTQTVGAVVRSVGYHYDVYGRLDQLTYPSGMIVVFGYTNGQATSINAAGQGVLSGVLYSPFGAVKSWTWGNSQAYARGIDLDGRVTSYPRNTNYQTLGFDNASRIISLTDSSNSALNQGYGYDVLDRLTADTQINGGTQPSRGYTYDLSGNRLTSTVAGMLPTNYTIASTSNRLNNISGGQLATYSYDAMGNIQSDGSRTFVYNARGRMSSVTVSGQTTSYTINAFGQRVKKVTGVATTIFVYDESGQLLGEYDGSGNQIAEHIYLNGMPVAVMKFVAGNPKVYQVYPDHLGTPRAVVDPAVARPVWEWHNINPFGGNLANENPAGLATFKYSLRLPGQYYDAETQTHYNYFRDYDPLTGRYEQSDPVGLVAGINTYAYVRARPLALVDRRGLQGERPICWLGSCSFPGDPDYPGAGSHYPFPRPRNGNILPGFSPQDFVCSSPASSLNSNLCAKRCCLEHDACFTRFGCNVSSWIGSLDSPCGMCNRTARNCIVSSIFNCPENCPTGSVAPYIAP